MDGNGVGQLFWSELRLRSVQKSIQEIYPIKSASDCEVLRRFFHENRAIEESSQLESNDDGDDLTSLFPFAKSSRLGASGLRSTKTAHVSSCWPSEVSRIPSDAKRTAIEVDETIHSKEEESALFDSAEKSFHPANESRRRRRRSVDFIRLLDLFPFHLVVNSSGSLMRVGPALLPLLMTPSDFSPRFHYFAEFFHLIYPVKNLPAVFDLLDLRSKPHTAILEMKGASSGFLVLKGEIGFVADKSDNLLLLLYPLKPADAVMSSAVDWDLAHRIRDLADVAQRTNAESNERTRLKDLLDDIEAQMSRFEAEKSKTDGLLCSIFPASVMESLRVGRIVQPDTFDPVTVLFADIVQFTALCGDVHVTPMDVVRMLNHLYTKFDLLSSLNEVYKVR